MGAPQIGGVLSCFAESFSCVSIERCQVLFACPPRRWSRCTPVLCHCCEACGLSHAEVASHARVNAAGPGRTVLFCLMD